MKRFLCLLLLVFPLALGGCDPCRGLDSAFALPVVAAMVDPGQGPQLEIQASIPALSARLQASFAGGQTAFPGGTLIAQTMSLERRQGRVFAVLGVRLQGAEGGAGVLEAPVRVVGRAHGAGLRVYFEPEESTLLIPGHEADSITNVAATEALTRWLAMSPVLALPGWFRTAETLPLKVLEARIDGPVVIVAVATGLAGPSLSPSGRARRPGLADDATLTLSLELLSTMAAAGFVPIPTVPDLGRDGEAESAPTLPTMPAGWLVRAGIPRPGERSVHLPFTARRTDRCGAYEAVVESRPGIALGAPGWRSPSPVEERLIAGDGPAPAEAIAVERAALARLLAPVIPMPLLGPGVVLSDRGPTRLVRIDGDALLLDAVLTGVTAPARPRAIPGQLPPPIVPRASP